MELILDFYALGIQSAQETANKLLALWIKENGGMISGGKLAGRIACLNEPLRNAMVDLLNLKK